MKYNRNSWHFKLFGGLLILAILKIIIQSIINL